MAVHHECEVHRQEENLHCMDLGSSEIMQNVPLVAPECKLEVVTYKSAWVMSHPTGNTLIQSER